MINMSKAELYRIVKSRGFILFWLLAVGTLMISVIYHQTGGISLGAPLNYDESIKMDIRQTATNFSFYFYLVIPVFTIISGEFGEHTVKNSITSAFSKRGFYVAKFCFAFVYTMLCFIAANYLFYFINKAVNGEEYSSPIGEYSKALFAQVPLFMAVVAVFIFLAFLLRKGSAFNAVTLISPILYTSVLLALYSIESTKKIATKLLNYELSVMIGKLAIDGTDSYKAKCYAVSAVVIVLSFVLGYFSWTKREID